MAVGRPRVLMLTASLGYGGSESSFMRLANYLKDHCDVEIVVFAKDYGGSVYFTAETESTIPLDVLNDSLPQFRCMKLRIFKWLYYILRVRRKKNRFDVTLSFLSGPNLLNALSGQGRHSIVSERGSKRYHTGISTWRKRLWLLLLDPLTYSLVRWVVPVSSDYASEVRETAWPGAKAKVLPIDGGVATRELIQLAAGIPDIDIDGYCNSQTVVFCGRLDRGKGAEELIAAFVLAKRRLESGRMLVIGDGPLLASLKALCLSMGLTYTTHGNPCCDVYFAGYRENPLRHYRLCGVFVFPSFHEGLGNSLLEAVAAGVRILAADCPWGPRSILGGRASVVVPSPDLPERTELGVLLPMIDSEESRLVWAEHIVEAISAPRFKFSEASRVEALSRYDILTAGRSWMELIAGVTDKRNLAVGDD